MWCVDGVFAVSFLSACHRTTVVVRSDIGRGSVVPRPMYRRRGTAFGSQERRLCTAETDVALKQGLCFRQLNYAKYHAKQVNMIAKRRIFAIISTAYCHTNNTKKNKHNGTSSNDSPYGQPTEGPV